MNECLSELLESWRISNEINLFILRWMPTEGPDAVTLLQSGKPSRGRNVSRIFAHMHEVRCSKLERNLDDSVELPRFEGSEAPDADRLVEALESFSDAVEKVVRSAVESGSGLEG